MNTRINELSEAFATINYLDQAGQPYTPDQVVWRLWDDTNDLILQDWSAPLPPATTNTVVVPGALNRILNPLSETEDRVVIFQITQNSVVVGYARANYTVVAIPSLDNLA